MLVVDDDEIVREVLSAMLRSAGYAVRTAASGSEAVHLLGSTSVQVLLTDWQMPEMDGIELCRLARRGSADAYLYILMLTVRDSEDDLLKCLQAGADDFIVKGASPAELIARVGVARRITRLDNSLRERNGNDRRLPVAGGIP